MESTKNVDNKTFSQKHPRLNFLFGLFLLLLFFALVVIAVYIVGKYRVVGMRTATNWLSSLASKLYVVVVALIAGCVSIIGYK